MPGPRPSVGRSEDGVALPSAVVMLTIVAIALAGLAFLGTTEEPPPRARTASQATEARASDAATSEPPRPTPAPEPTRRPEPKLVRGEVFVEVYNNTGVQGLAASTAIDVANAGWNTVGTDNWVGTVPATTVYYPPRLERAARALARDLGIDRVARAVDPMKLDRLTVILAADFA